jgi:hypothetical protein
MAPGGDDLDGGGGTDYCYVNPGDSTVGCEFINPD